MRSTRTPMLSSAAGVAALVVLCTGAPAHAAHVSGHALARGGPVLSVAKSAHAHEHVTTSTSYISPTTTGVAVTIPAGKRTLVNVVFFAETSCASTVPQGTDPAGDIEYCHARILVGGVEAVPLAGKHPFALDSSDQGDEGRASWEGHGMERHRCLPAPTTTTSVKVQVQFRVVNGGGSLPAFWFDDTHLAATVHDGGVCQGSQ